MSEFGKQMEDLSEHLRSARDARQREVEARGRWLASFRGDEVKARDNRAASFEQSSNACRQQRKIRLSELFSRTRHLLGRFRIEHKERTDRTLEAFEASSSRRAEDLGRLMGSCQRRRLNWHDELDRANKAWSGHQVNGAQPSVRSSPSAKSQERSTVPSVPGAGRSDKSEAPSLRSWGDRRTPASRAQSGSHASASASSQPAHRAHQGHKRGGAR